MTVFGSMSQAVHGQPHGGVAQRRRLGVRGLGGLDDLPVVGLEDGALRLGQRAVRVVDDQARAQRHEGRVDVDRVGVAGEVHGVHAVLGVVALEPVHGGAVGGQAVLDEQALPMRITSAASHIGSTSVVTKSLAAVRSRRSSREIFSS